MSRLKKLWSLGAVLDQLDILVEPHGVGVGHRNGSYVRFRSDGNLDVYAGRNLWLRTEEALLLNCSAHFDALTRQQRLEEATRDIDEQIVESSWQTEDWNSLLDYSDGLPLRALTTSDNRL